MDYWFCHPSTSTYLDVLLPLYDILSDFILTTWRQGKEDKGMRGCRTLQCWKREEGIEGEIWNVLTYFTKFLVLMNVMLGDLDYQMNLWYRVLELLVVDLLLGYWWLRLSYGLMNLFYSFFFHCLSLSLSSCVLDFSNPLSLNFICLSSSHDHLAND